MGLLTKELINSTFQFQTCELDVHFLKDKTVIVETCGLSVEDLILNKVLVKMCVASGRAEGMTCVFVAASWS